MKKISKNFLFILSIFLFLQSSIFIYAEEASPETIPAAEEQKTVYKNKKHEQKPDNLPVAPSAGLNNTAPAANAQTMQPQQAQAEATQTHNSPFVTPAPKKEVPAKPAPKPAAPSNENANQSNEQPENIPPLPENENTVPSEAQPTNEIILPEVSFDEISHAETISQLTPEKAAENNMIKSIVSLALVIIGVVVILTVIFSNRRIPKSYEPNIKFRHAAKQKNKNTKRYSNKNYY